MLDQQQEAQDTEVTLGVGKLLGLFFLLVILCGVFFSLGYSLGKSSQKTEGSLIGDRNAPSTSETRTTGTSKQAEADSDSRPEKPVEQKAPEVEKKPGATAESNPPLPELKASSGGAFVVQVAAVSKKEDAEALQQALQRKQYPVVVSPGAGDKLFHVQIGPFADLKDAETMKGRLASDGYNAIVKK
jgi:cell division septation protein DedD